MEGQMQFIDPKESPLRCDVISAPGGLELAVLESFKDFVLIGIREGQLVAVLAADLVDVELAADLLQQCVRQARAQASPELLARAAQAAVKAKLE